MTPTGGWSPSRREVLLVVLGAVALSVLALGIFFTYHGGEVPGRELLLYSRQGEPADGPATAQEWSVRQGTLLAALVGQAVAAVLLLAATASPGRRGHTATRRAVGLWGALTSGALLPGSWAWLYLSHSPWLSLPLTAGLILGVVAGVSVAWGWGALRPSRATALVATLPFVVASAPVLVAGQLADPQAQLVAFQGLVPVLMASEFVAGVVVLALLGATLHLARSATIRSLPPATPARALGVLVWVKIVWIAFARTNAELSWIGAIVAPWQLANRSSLWEWVAAVLFLLLVALMLGRSEELLRDDRTVGVALAAVCFAFVAPLALPATVGVATPLLMVFFGSEGGVVTGIAIAVMVVWLRRPARSPRRLALRVAGMVAVIGSATVAKLALWERWATALELGQWLGSAVRIASAEFLMAVMVPMIGLVGALLMRREETRTSGIVAVLFAAWSLPRALELGLLGVFATEIELLPRLLTFDTALTVTVLVGWVSWRRGWQQRFDPAVLSVALVVGTVATHPAAVPDTWRASAFAVLVVAPVAYLVAVQAHRVRRAETTVGTMLLALAASCGVLAVALIMIDAGAMAPGEVLIVDLGPRLFAVPLAAVLVVAAAGLRGAQSRSFADGSHAARRSPPLAGEADQYGAT